MLKNQIEQVLKSALDATYIAVVDDSAKHAGHAEATKSGGRHYSVVVVSRRFEDKNLLERHRIVYAALKERMQKGIHALQITALTPGEYSKQSNH